MKRCSRERRIPRNKEVRDNFITIVPRKDVVTSIKDFRPISQVGNIYKIIHWDLRFRKRRNFTIWLNFCMG